MRACLRRRSSRRRAVAAAGRQARGLRRVRAEGCRHGVLGRAAALRNVAPAVAVSVCAARRCAAGVVREQVDGESFCAAGVVGQGAAVRHHWIRARPTAIPAGLRAFRTAGARRAAALLASTCARIGVMSDMHLLHRQRESWASLRAARQLCQRCTGEAGCQPMSCCFVCPAAAAESAPSLRCTSAQAEALPLPRSAQALYPTLPNMLTSPAKK